MGKWIAGIIGSIIVGVAIWALTTLLPNRLKEKEQTREEPVIVSCTPNPPTVAAGEISELTITVTKGGKPIPDAHLLNGMEDWGTTASDGTARIQWHAPPGAYQGGIRFRISASPTERDGGGGGEGDCQIMYKS